jgi:hypothetical protein
MINRVKKRSDPEKAVSIEAAFLLLPLFIPAGQKFMLKD